MKYVLFRAILGVTTTVLLSCWSCPKKHDNHVPSLSRRFEKTYRAVFKSVLPLSDTNLRARITTWNSMKKKVRTILNSSRGTSNGTLHDSS